jgi:hypothetical protein
MLSRRNVMRMLAALPFVGGAAKVAGATAREPRILYEQPERAGIPGASYFVPGDAAEAWLGGKGLTVRGFAGGQDLRCVVFEIDTAAGWVGIMPHYFVGDRLYLSTGPRYWVAGDIRVAGKQHTLKPYAGALVLPLDRLKSKIKYKAEPAPDGPDGSVRLRFTADVSEAQREYERFVADVRNLPAR